MADLTLFSVFSGLCGYDWGASWAGARHIGGIEMDRRIAAIARMNGFKLRVSSILDVDLLDVPKSDIFHASPPCPSFSVNNKNKGETDNDRALAEWVGRVIAKRQPKFVTMENVDGYRTSDSWGIISAQLLRHKYSISVWNLLAANYGVPQTRERMIAVARLDGRAQNKPPSTHQKNKGENSTLPLFEDFQALPSWIGWYEAVSDILHQFPESYFAEWQKKILPSEFDKSFLVNTGNPNGNEKRKYRMANEPAKTIMADGSPLRAFLLWPDNTSSVEPLYGDSPVPTVTAQTGAKSGKPKVFLNGKPGKIVEMNTEALARFQSLYGYKLPSNKKNNKIVCRGIGNAVPALLSRAIVASL